MRTINMLAAVLALGTGDRRCAKQRSAGHYARNYGPAAAASGKSRPCFRGRPDRCGRQCLARRLHALCAAHRRHRGAVVAVVKDGKIVTERGYGYSDVEKRTPVDPKLTLFRPGSVSKLITWTAVMQLVEQGKIDLDADVNRYLDFKIPPRDGKPVTMRNLMQHTAGFEEQAKGIMSEDPKAPRFEALLKQWVPQRVFAPGSTPAYSNYGASLAGYIVQRVSGESHSTSTWKSISLRRST